MRKQSLVAIVCFLVASVLLFSDAAVWAKPPDLMKTAKSQKKAAEGRAEDPPLLPENLDAAGIDTIIAKLSDEQVRRLLISELKKDALRETGHAQDVKNAKEVGRLAGFILGLKNNIFFVRERIKFLQIGFGAVARDISMAGAALVSTDGTGNTLKNILHKLF